jgi:hypothetical protein
MNRYLILQQAAYSTFLKNKHVQSALAKQLLLMRSSVKPSFTRSHFSTATAQENNALSLQVTGKYFIMIPSNNVYLLLEIIGAYLS